MDDDLLQHRTAPAPRPEGWEPPPRSSRGKWVLLAIVGTFIILPFTPLPGKLKRGVIDIIDRAKGDSKTRVEVREKVVEKRVEVPAAPEPLPPKFVPNKRVAVNTLFNDMKFTSRIIPTEGESATKERATKDSYGVEFTINVKIPKPTSTTAELTALNPQLATLLPGLDGLVKTAKVSGFYHYLYDLKQKSLERSILRLDQVLSRHNFYDVETILELEHPQTKQKALLLQGEMDVVSDGSDGDRMPTFDDYIFKSQHFQPTSSYGWPKVTTQPNPLVARLEDEQRTLKAKRAADQTAEEKSRLADLPLIIADLKKRSFLIAQEDPFIVIPTSLRSYEGYAGHTPSIGDYAVVIHGSKLLPAIVGDYGPITKMGEASLRIARELDPQAGPYRRPVSDLKVTYIIFPGSAERPFRQPDYAAWQKRCAEYLEKSGLTAANPPLHTWDDRLKKAAEERARLKAEAEAKAKAEAEAKARADAEKKAKAAQPAAGPR